MSTRILTAVIGAPVILGAVLWSGGTRPFPGWPFALFVLALCAIALHEFYEGCRRAGYTPRDGTGYAVALLFILCATPLLGEDPAPLLLGVTLLLMASLAWEALRPCRAPLKSLPATWLGALYVGWLFSFAVRLRLGSSVAAAHLGWAPPSGWMGVSDAGAWLVLFTLLVTSAVDTGAYLTGKAIGRHKLAPEVSPGKTWEGSAGGFVTGMLVGWGLGRLFGLPLAFALVAAGLISIVAQLGDLSKSAMKREIGIKDFGALLPGHGGVLDRFDSLLFTAPTVYCLICLWGG